MSDLALDAYQRSLELDPDNEALISAIKRLKKVERVVVPGL